MIWYKRHAVTMQLENLNKTIIKSVKSPYLL